MENLPKPVIKRIKAIHKEFMTGKGDKNSACEKELTEIKEKHSLTDQDIYKIYWLKKA